MYFTSELQSQGNGWFIYLIQMLVSSVLSKQNSLIHMATRLPTLHNEAHGTGF